MEFAQHQRAADAKVTYPPGVKEITDKISNDEVVKRLKMVVKTFMDMDQDSEDEKQQYLALALHLASEFFLRNPNKDVRLLVACCLADIFRIYAPEAPYTSHDKLKDIFLFITRQLKGLEDTKSPQFNRYFYLLENLAWVKSYNICFELEDCNEIFIQLFKTLFSVINASHNQKVHMHMLDLMSSIITEGDGVTQELLDTILINLIPAHKNLNKQAYDLAKILLKRTFFNQVLVLGKSSVSDLSEHVFDLIQELFAIDPHLLVSVMPQLEFKLKSNDGEERLAVVRLLAKLFGARDSELASNNRPLWQCFLGRFNDIHVPVRLECVKFASHCLMNHPDLAKDLTDYLKVRSHDPEEAIRHDVIVTIINAGKKDLNLVNDQLLGFVRERTLDKRWRVRKEAMMGLAQLYKKYCLHHEAGKESAQKISWIKDKLLHIYYQNSIDDKLLVEKIFAQFMVPHSLETEEKMKCLYYLYACLDPNAVKALNEMWKCQNMLRSHVRELLDLHKQPTPKLSHLPAENLPDPGKAQDFVKKFNQVLGEDEKLRAQLEMLISPTCSCKQAEVCVREISRKLTFPKQPTNPFLEMVKFLLERIAPVHIDSEAISALVKLLNKSIEGTADDEDEGVTPDTAIRSGLELLKVLSFTHPTSFHSAETYESLLQCLKMEDDKVAEAAIQIFRNTGQKIEAELPHIRSTLIPVLHQKAKRGTPHQAKQAVHCIHAIFHNKEVQLAQIFESIGNRNGKLWTPDDEVSPEVLAKVQAIKLLVRWLLGMKNNQSKSANSTLRLLSAMLVSEGDLTEQKKISKSDMSRLRLAAGSAIMKLAQEPCYHDIITPEQFQLCALVINDECYQVRQMFAQKLHLALAKLLLPLEYMAVFALCAKDPVKERRAHARQCLLKNISVRREYIKQNPMAHEKLVSLLPEYVVPYMIHLLAHDPDFTKPQDSEQLRDIKECLWFMLEVLMTKNENNSHAFLRKMVENIKQTKDAQAPDDPKVNEKLYVVCDVALLVIANKSTACHLESPKDPDFVNNKEYLSSEARTTLLTGKPKPTPVLGTVNKPLSVTGRRPYTKTTPSDVGSNISGTSQPSSPADSKGRDGGAGAGASENEENPGIVLAVKTDGGKKDTDAGQASGDQRGKKREGSENNATPTVTPATPTPLNKPRRGRPPKSLASSAGGVTSAEKEGSGVGRGRKRALPPQDTSPAAEPVTKTPKQQKDTDSKRATPQRQKMDTEAQEVKDQVRAPGRLPKTLRL
ncbi:sister chromatid cohesion protein PDS5A-like [Scleropages formosus]|uniref:Sister chromatid cohesion protein PDS5A-like n=1 Tax=Scleropages formosus TaxID=113540 RepID=A0A0P7UDA6_SCLFO|nr:sister chromatid cohesion protein PDS5A-like [Scleropages formosus]